jgi:hypothetical protein
MPRQATYLRKKNAPPRKPPDPTLDQPYEGTTRTNVTLGIVGTILSTSLAKTVPKPRAPGGYRKKKRNIPSGAPSPPISSPRAKGSPTPLTGNWCAPADTSAQLHQPRGSHISSNPQAKVQQKQRWQGLRRHQPRIQEERFQSFPTASRQSAACQRQHQ